MLIAVLALVVTLQAQTPAPVVQVAALPPAGPTSPPPPEAAPEAAAPEFETGPGAEEPRTRQVCRYVEVPGRRFPARRCRTVPVED
jgi:hypothetical protein